MSACFALLLFASSVQAGVVMPVETGVAPAGPSAAMVPVMTPGTGSLGSPSQGASTDLRGTIPLLPAPAPGLSRPAVYFIGNTPAATAVQTEPASAPAAQSSEGRREGGERAPSVPAKPLSGTPTHAVALDKKSGSSRVDNDLSLSRERDHEAAVNPLTQSSSLEHAVPEKASDLGRRFFDQSSDNDRGALADSGAQTRPAPAIAATILEGGAFGPGFAGTGSLARRDSAAVIGSGHARAPSVLEYESQSEVLHDAVASVPSGALAPRGGAAAPVYRFATGHQNLPVSGGASAGGYRQLPSAPLSLSLDRSHSGLIVRVRSALSGALSPVRPAPAAAKIAVPGPSTALLERGGMLEAFSVAGAYSDSVAAAKALTIGISQHAHASVPPVPGADFTPPLWWAVFVLPLFAAAIRGIL